MAPFEWRFTSTWAKLEAPGDEAYVLAFLPVSSSSNHDGRASGLQVIFLRAGARANTTDWTCFFQINLGSLVNVLERVLPNARLEAIRMQRVLLASFWRHFAGQVQAWLNNVEDDAEWRDAMVDQMRQGEQLYSAEETALIAEGAAQLDAFAKGEGKVRSLKYSKTVKMAQVRYDETTGRIVGEVECAIHGASPDELVAYLMHFESKINKSQLNSEVDVRYEILEMKSFRHVVAFSEMKTAPLRNRTFMGAMLWQKVSDAPLTYIWVLIPIKDHPKSQSNKRPTLCVVRSQDAFS